MTHRCAVSLALLWLAALLWGCADEGQQKITIDLTTSPVCHVGDQPARPPTRGGGAEAELLQIDARPIDFYQWLPSGSVLLGELPSDVSPDDVRVSVTSSERQEVLELVSNSAGVWRADLGGFGDALVRLRLENRSEGPLSWGRLRIAGIETRVAPLLPPPPGAGRQVQNFLVYVVDALRADHLSVYGYERPTSPHLAEFARAGAVFLQAYSAGPNTGTSIPSLLTSLVPSEVVGRLHRSEEAVSHTVAELFFDAGFETAGFEANLLLRKYMGYGRGFETFKVFSRKVDGVGASITATELHEHVVEWLEKPRERPFFLFVQSMDVHHPYDPPAPFRGRFGSGDGEAPPELTYLPEDMSPSVAEFYQQMVRSLEPQYYDDGIAYADHELGLLLAALTDLGLRDSTAIIITADHGESLGEGGRFLHGLSLNEEQVHVPLLVSVPWLREPLRVHSLVSHAAGPGGHSGAGTVQGAQPDAIPPPARASNRHRRANRPEGIPGVVPAPGRVEADRDPPGPQLVSHPVRSPRDTGPERAEADSQQIPDGPAVGELAGVPRNRLPGAALRPAPR
ncbi:MAG: sulfatase-like hydrolase/transferase [Deltaproteobacteria bacterium]|nr:sulfatase-like hydrolase/transferase [Deltaproteobacteria bacterium]